MTMGSDMRERILMKAAEDSDFRARLLADPKAAIAAETGQPIPDGLEVVVHEDSATTAHLVLQSSAALTEAELELAVGGQTLGSGHPIGAPGETA